MKTFFRFIRNILLLALLAFGIYTYQHNPNVRIATQDSITTLGQRINQLLTTGKTAPPKLGDKLNTQSNHQEKASLNKETGKNKYRTWDKPEATVYVDMNNDPTLRAAAIDALNN